MSQPTILTVILNYRTPDDAMKAAEAALVAMEGLAGEVAIVDNDSQDGSFRKIKAAVAAKGWAGGGRVHVYETGHNGGFGSGNNFAIRAGLSTGDKPDYVYLVNPDAIAEPEAIRTLVAFLEARPEAGIAGSLILKPDGRRAYGAFEFPGLVREFEEAARTMMVSRIIKLGRIHTAPPEEQTQVDWVSGSSVMMRRSMLDEIGLFDETYFLYFEETDLCLRAKRAGWQVWYLPESRVVHIGGVSTGMFTWKRQPKYWFDSRLHYFTKNYGRAYTVLTTLALLAGEGVWMLRRLVNPKAERYRQSERFARDLIEHSVQAMFARRDAPAGGSGGSH
ncbi:MAG: glycosyltransferase family 2 protein [Maritimibacter sp.]|nr:glycosyltransferase family 2 protein [Maritimibacter sp.]